MVYILLTVKNKVFDLTSKILLLIVIQQKYVISFLAKPIEASSNPIFCAIIL